MIRSISASFLSCALTAWFVIGLGPMRAVAQTDLEPLCYGKMPIDDRIVLETPIGRVEDKVCIQDGDSFSVGPAFIRLKGIDAPRLGRDCMWYFTNKTQPDWPKRCRGGAYSVDQLIERLSKGVTCKAEKHDGRYRWLAECRSKEGADLANLLLQDGAGCAAMRYVAKSTPRPTGHQLLELEARLANRGIWDPQRNYGLSKICSLGR
jgi:endonuclease YncB( thermonuclease family)